MRLSRPLAALAVAVTISSGLLAMPGTAVAASRHVRGTAGHDRPDPAVKRFELRGTVSQVDPSTHSVTVRLALRRHGKRVTVSVPLTLANNARIKLNGARVTDRALQVGDRVQIGGVLLRKTDGSRWLLGLRVNAHGVREVPPPDDSPTPEPTPDPSPSPEPTSNTV